MHEHKDCEHDLKFCTKCDVVYCERCNKEWYSYKITATQPYIYYGDGNTEYPNVSVSLHNHE